MPLIAHMVGHTWTLFLEAAPWLLLGLAIAGLLKAWIPERRMAAALGGKGLWPTTKAAFIGAPLPLCSCGVIPAAFGLHRAGASRASTTAFLIATPETGADSVGASYALLGPFFTVLRPVAAVASGIITGMLSGLAPATPVRRSPGVEGNSCCGSSCGGGEEEQVKSTIGCDTGCCSTSSASASDKPRSPWRRTAEGLHYAITDILDDFSLWLVVGLVVAGITITFVPPSALAQYGSGWPAMLAMLVVGVPLYVCATESTPIAAAMLLAGVSPGAVLVFLLAGPATNIGTVGALYKEFGARYVAVYLSGISGCALAFGWLTDAIVGRLDINVVAQLHASRDLVPEWLALICGLLLIVLAVPILRAPLLQLLQRPESSAR
ncbi:MAG: SO_0444 family Cu/Zn efflux transporter [Salinisphaera sp.]|jgi:uncharacterized membrane protein YraQ (UPF0718 family)|nr:SO_0444 family Cu/Zn efflux transporter [Salinisphaera sp.]